jgi:hypothetical protein
MRFAALVPIVFLLACQASAPPAPAAAPAAAAEPVPTPAAEPSGFDEERAIAELKARIAGKEKLPAREVFENVQLLGDVPAARLLGVMQMGYSRSLGVTCTHCHVSGMWEADDKDPKKTARDMMRMMRAINEDYLKKIATLQNESPAVNCTTCHRGQLKPALNLGPPRAGV